MSNSLVSCDSLSIQKIHDLFQMAKSPSKAMEATRSACLSFFEPSTRTLMSFQKAALNLDMRTAVLPSKESSSLTKGEGILETLVNLDQMGFDLHIVRAPQDFDMQVACETLKTPVINAGWGSLEHPTQALLDAYTINIEFGSLQDKTICFLGDTKFSRVYGSSVSLYQRLGAKVITVSPDIIHRSIAGVENFSNVSDVLDMVDVVIPLRTQLERFGSLNVDMNRYIDTFGFRSQHLASLKKSAIVLAPGPVNIGIEMDLGVYESKQSRILNQVQNGVAIRRAIIQMILE